MAFIWRNSQQRFEWVVNNRAQGKINSLTLFQLAPKLMKFIIALNLEIIQPWKINGSPFPFLLGRKICKPVFFEQLNVNVRCVCVPCKVPKSFSWNTAKYMLGRGHERK